MRHVIHHEYFHMVEEQVNGSAYFKDPKWAALNTKGFKYGSGGDKMRDGNVTPLTHPQAGFVTSIRLLGWKKTRQKCGL